MSIRLEQAQSIVTAALSHARAQGFKPLTVAALDPGGAGGRTRARRRLGLPAPRRRDRQVHDDAGTLLGAAGASGDASLADEEAVVAGIRAAGLVPRTGAES